MTTQAADPQAKIAQAKLAATPLADVVSDAKHGGHVVQLDPPPGASAGLRAFIEMGETAIQTAVDLLGRGLPKLPPDVGDLLQPSVYKSLGEGEASKAYQKTVDKVEAKQMELLKFDSQIVKTSDTIGLEKSSALNAILDIAKKLQTTLKSAGIIKKPQQEPPLLKAVADAVQRVYDKVAAAAALNENLAGGDGKNTGGSSTGSTATQSSSGNGGGDIGSILQSLLPMAAMIPMMAMPLAQQIPEMLKKAEEDKQKKAEQNQNGGTPPAPGQTPPPPGDPNVAAAAATAPGEQNQNGGTPPPGQTAPPGDPNAAAAPATAVRNASRRRQPPAEGQPVSTLPADDAEPDPEPSPAASV